ncbi:hypothetical protein LTR56_018081 [Elasticomyces elasticus]|nr:hypothetical protein LTR56_018081 [Elasticomyces elasticus]KAK3639519.1 hypothetical protein LTR22_017381 [Elasticomyces elasticus]KAK4913171.1 hypothetical protein LTR49_018445 [Elasticomyces elasticus]KAK5752753.1 hypothetical protein LTS12_017136 [Elasticomyces elasticus]
MAPTPAMPSKEHHALASAALHQNHDPKFPGYRKFEYNKRVIFGLHRATHELQQSTASCFDYVRNAIDGDPRMTKGAKGPRSKSEHSKEARQERLARASQNSHVSDSEAQGDSKLSEDGGGNVQGDNIEDENGGGGQQPIKTIDQTMCVTGSQGTERIPEPRSTENSRVLEPAKEKDSGLPPSQRSTVEVDTNASGRGLKPQSSKRQIELRTSE